MIIAKKFHEKPILFLLLFNTSSLEILVLMIVKDVQKNTQIHNVNFIKFASLGQIFNLKIIYLPLIQHYGDLKKNILKI